jgi:ABC-type enterochelin transport system substrate-binding protein
VAVVDAELEEKFRQALKTIGKSYNIKATTPIVCKMIDLSNGDSEPVDNWHYLADIFGPKVPAEVGALLSDVVMKFKDRKDITDKNRWQVLEYLAADWLAK